jgi:hypothetical protein
MGGSQSVLPVSHGVPRGGSRHFTSKITRPKRYLVSFVVLLCGTVCCLSLFIHGGSPSTGTDSTVGAEAEPKFAISADPRRLTDADGAVLEQRAS